VGALPEVDDRDVRETIVRALSVPFAKGSARALVDEFSRYDATEPLDDGFQARWAVGNALAVVADDSVFDELVELVRDVRNGRAREMLAVALAKMKDPAADDVLIGLLDDAEVAGHAVIALGKRRTLRARPRIEPFLEDPKDWIRTEARKALKRIDAAVERPGEPLPKEGGS
jgi:HEAT repeat protein